jgi:xylulokinase
MWVKALDMLMEKLRIIGVDFAKVAAISGAGQVDQI